MNAEELAMLMDLKDQVSKLQQENAALTQVILTYYQAASILAEINAGLGLTNEIQSKQDRQGPSSGERRADELRDQKGPAQNVKGSGWPVVTHGRTDLPFPEAQQITTTAP